MRSISWREAVLGGKGGSARQESDEGQPAAQNRLQSKAAE
jgi:hypothetical protein